MDNIEKRGILYLPMFENEPNSNNLELLRNLLLSKYDKVAYFTPIDSKCDSNLNSCISVEDFERDILKNEQKEIRKKVIKRYEDILEKNDFVIVVGTQVSYLDKFELNCKIANDLNIPILVDYQDSKFAKFHKIRCDKYNVENLGHIENKIINFQSGTNFALESLTQKELFNEFQKCTKNIVTPVKFEYDLFKKASKNIKTVVLPEGNDERVLKAANILAKTNAVNLIMLGKESDIKNKEAQLGLDLSKVRILNNNENDYLDEFANLFYELRKSKGMDLKTAKQTVKDRNYFATMLAFTGKADAVVSGADGTTADTIRPALQIVKTKEGISSVSGSFFICLDTQVCLFADCAVIPNPTSKQLCDCAIASIDTARSFGIDPKVAMLSYSTGDSGSGISVDLVKEGVKFANSLAPNEYIDGPIQFDAAVDETVAKKKMPNSKVAGKANVFIFPDLNSGNIAYKGIRRTAGAIAIGPLLQGLKKPINDLSRGCTVEDIVNTVLISAIQAGG